MKRGKVFIVTGSLCLVLAMAALLLMVGCAAEEAAQEERVYRIGELTIVSQPDPLAIRQAMYQPGFAERLAFHRVMAEAGFVEGVNVEYISLSAEGDMTLAKTIADRFVSEKVDLIHAITTPIAQVCVAAAKGTGIPVVFSSATASPATGIVSTWEAPRPDNVTGVSNIADLKAQMEQIKLIHPEVKALGVIYNASEANSVAQIELLKDIMADVGIEELVEQTCSKTAEVATAAVALIGSVDAIYIPTDSTAISGLESVIAVAEENKIPTFGSTWDMVERGCIAALFADYNWIGQEAGQYAARILKSEFASDIPVVWCPREALKLVLNLEAADRMGITIPTTALKDRRLKDVVGGWGE